jgi:hypothetical protein
MSDPESTHGVDAAMRNYAEKAVEMARSRGVELDYSLKSVHAVEEMAGSIRRRAEGRLHADASGDPSPDWDPSEYPDYSELALTFGAYIGEVMRRRWGGNWHNPGQGARLRIGAEDLNPCGLAYFRLTREHDNLAEYVRRVAKKREG